MRRVLTMLAVLVIAVGLAQAANLNPNAKSETGYSAQPIDNPLRPDSLDFYILGNGDHGSGSTAATALRSRGYAGLYVNDSTFTGHPDLTSYRSVWVFVPGILGTNTRYPLMQSGGADETKMVAYLNAGGKRMYFEHPDMGWACDPGGGNLLTTFYPMLHIGSYNDYSANMAREVGVSGRFTQGMDFSYNPMDTGANGGNDIDALTAGSGAFPLFTTQTGGENQCIGYDSGTYRTILSCFLFRGLNEGSPPSTKAIYADSIMHFFGIRAQGVEESGDTRIPVTFDLGPARPNPASQGTAIRFGLPVESQVSLKVYDLSGRLVSTLVDSKLPAGYHQARWDRQGNSSGVYFYRLESGSYSATRKLVLVR